MKNLKTIIASVLLATSLMSCSSEDQIIEEAEIYKPVKSSEEIHFEELVDIVNDYVDIIESVGSAVEYDYETYIDDQDLQYDSFLDGVRYSNQKNGLYFYIDTFFYKKFLGNRYLSIIINGKQNLKYRKVFKIENNADTVEDLLSEMYFKIYKNFYIIE
jgi:hypothetical protein